MATFIPNITDVFPQPSLYTPDFDRISRNLYQKESLYRQGAQKVKSLYDSAINSELTRDGNVERRAAYLKTIQDGLKTIAASDLSLPQNASAADNLFEPVFTDKDMVHDILWTRSYNNEASKAESFRNSTDPATRKQYWETGARALQYQREEYRNADNNSALSMSAPKYVGNIDLLTYANKMYKDAGIKVSVDDISKGYIITRQNGDVAVPVTKQFVDMMVASDPAIASMMKTQAYVQRKDFVKQNAAAYGGEDRAEMVYIQNVLKTVDASNQAQFVADTDHSKDARAKMDKWEQIITTRGIVPGSDEHKKYLADMQAASAAEQTVDIKKDMIIHPSLVNKQDLNDLRAAADRAMFLANLGGTTNQLTAYLAYKDQKISRKADPISMAYLHDGLAEGRQKRLASIHLQNQKDLLKWKRDNGYETSGGDGMTKSEQRKYARNQGQEHAVDDLFEGYTPNYDEDEIPSGN